MNTEKIIISVLVLLVAVTIVNGFLIFSISAEKEATPTTGLVTGKTVSQGAPTAASGDVAKVAAEVLPKGKPAYGDAAGVSFDNVEESLKTLANYHRGITLSGADQQRYIKISTTDGTACEFCCGLLGSFGTPSGQLACECEHNIAFSGVTKWLIKNSDYTDEQILQELHKWKASFFPGPTVQKAMAQNGMSTGSGLPQQVGGC